MKIFCFFLAISGYSFAESPAVQTSLDKETQNPKPCQVQTSLDREIKPVIIVVSPTLPVTTYRAGRGVASNVGPAMSKEGQETLLNKLKEVRGDK